MFILYIIYIYLYIIYLLYILYMCLLYMYIFDTCVSRYIQAYFFGMFASQQGWDPEQLELGFGDFSENSATELQIPENQQGGPGD